MKSIQLTKCMVIAFFAVLLSIVYGNPLLFETEAQSFGVEPEVYMDAVSNIKSKSDCVCNCLVSRYDMEWMLHGNINIARSRRLPYNIETRPLQT